MNMLHEYVYNLFKLLTLSEVYTSLERHTLVRTLYWFKVLVWKMDKLRRLEVVMNIASVRH